MAADVNEWATRLLLLLSLSSIKSILSDSLYNYKDSVIVLNAANFSRTIYGTDNAWMVEFYNSWCGHCIRFAPTYKKLADRVKDWRQVVQVAAIDCAEDQNVPMCNKYKISAYPSVKLIHPKSDDKNLGVDVSSDVTELEQLVEVLIKFIGRWSDSKIAASWPKLYPLQSMETIWKDVGPGVEHTAVFFEEPDSLIGRQVILDLMAYKQIVIRRMLPEHVAKYGIKQFPSMYLLDKGGTFKMIAGKTTRQGYVYAVKKLLGVKTEDGTAADSKKPEQQPSKTDIKSSQHRVVQGVHMQDLESTLQYSLRHEVASHALIDSKSLTSLKVYLRVLAKYFPGRDMVSKYLKRVSTWLDSQGQSITSTTWIDTINSLQTDDAYLPTTQKWTGCQGSAPQYRKYPCGLWTLFHTLSVNAVLDMAQDKSFNPQEILLAMRAYITSFFGCAGCVTNFRKSAVKIETEVKSPDSSILWLWKAHNRANGFLKGDITEDPQHPKQQWPYLQLCPQCHVKNSDQDWDYSAVLKFLKTFYLKSNIIADAEPFQFQREKVLPGSKNRNQIDRTKLVREDERRNELNPKHKALVRHDVSYNKKRIDRLRKIEQESRFRGMVVEKSWGFNSIDISMCVLVYIVGSGILLLVYFHFTVRRRTRAAHKYHV